MMITNLGFFTRILVVIHIKSINQRLCNGLVVLYSVSLLFRIFCRNVVSRK